MNKHCICGRGDWRGVGLALVLAPTVGLGCGGAKARPVAVPVEETAIVEGQSVEAGDIEYGMCGMQMVSGVGMPADAVRSFDAADAAQTGKDLEAAAKHYMAGAQELELSANAHDATIIYNRRVAYANAVNLWLSKHDIAAARTALGVAAQNDADLATELRFAAQQLPQSMSCTDATETVTPASVATPAAL